MLTHGNNDGCPVIHDISISCFCCHPLKLLLECFNWCYHHHECIRLANIFPPTYNVDRSARSQKVKVPGHRSSRLKVTEGQSVFLCQNEIYKCYLVFRFKPLLNCASRHGTEHSNTMCSSSTVSISQNSPLVSVRSLLFVVTRVPSCTDKTRTT